MTATQTMATYVPDAVERWGRRMKMEYVGMASVFVIIRFLFFGELPLWYQGVAASLASYFLFLGMKKKTRDHFSASWILFAGAAVASGPVIAAEWSLPYLLFGTCIWALEGYLEKRPNRIWALPLFFGLWGLVGPSWLLGFLFVASYLAEPREEKPELRRRLSGLVAGSGVLAIVTTTLWGPGWSSLSGLADQRLPLEPLHAWLLLGLGLPTLVCLGLYWSRLAMPHRLNTALFAVLAPWDLRLTALFALAAPVLLTATLFRQSIDSDRLRPLFKHAEWYFFWGVLAVAIWAAVGQS